jgi:hypothetical protein
LHWWPIQNVICKRRAGDKPGTKVGGIADGSVMRRKFADTLALSFCLCQILLTQVVALIFLFTFFGLQRSQFSDNNEVFTLIKFSKATWNFPT